MTRHTAVPFYASAFFIVMKQSRFDALPADVRQAIDSLSGDGLVARFGPLWNQWDQPFHEGAQAPGKVMLRPDAALLQRWKVALQPVSEAYVSRLQAQGFAHAREVYERLLAEPAGR